MSEDDRLRDDAAAWVLGALDDEEAREFARRLATGGAARDEVEELRKTADSLAFAVDPVDPPPELRDRIMAVVESEAALLHATDASADRPPVRRAPSRWRALLRPVPLAAAACVLLLAGLAAGLLVAGGGSDPARTVAAKVTGSDMAGARARLEIADDRAELIVDGMRAAGPGRVYQVWILHRGQTEPVPAGALFDVDRAGHGTAAVVEGVANAKTIMVSVEPAGGSDRPTSQPVIAADLS